MSTEGATANERLIAACRSDSLDLLNEVINDVHLNVNCTDAVGNPALNICIKQTSFDVFQELLKVPNIDLDIMDRLDRNSPLHVACLNQNPKAVQFAVEVLLEAGANPKLKNKNGQRPVDLLPNSEEFKEVKLLLLKAAAAQDLGLEAEEEEEDSDDEGASSE